MTSAHISKGEYQLPETLEPDLAALIKGILQINPGDRFSIQDMKNNRYSPPTSSLLPPPSSLRPLSVLSPSSLNVLHSWVATDIVSDEPFLPYTANGPSDHHHDVSVLRIGK
jgi:hypothetical protein